MRYWLGLGSNLGPRAGYLAEALLRLARRDVKLARLSSVYETAPVGITDQPDFLNMVTEVVAEVAPSEMVRLALEVEAELGRRRERPGGPRNIDVDVLMGEGVRTDYPQATVPHPRMMERQFVLVPLAEIGPRLLLPDGRQAREAADPQAPGLTRLGTLAQVVRKELRQGGRASAGDAAPLS